MTKQKKSVKETRVQSENLLSKFNLNEIIPQKHHPWIVLVVILILFLIFLNPLYFGNKTFQSGDIFVIESMRPYLEKDRDGYTLWNPYIFTGMPAYALATGVKWFNLIWLSLEMVHKAFMLPFSNDYVRWALYLIILAYTTFSFFYIKTKNTLLSVFVGITTAFSTGIIVFLYIGHVTKLTSLAFYPVIFLLLLKFQKGIRIRDFFLLAIILNMFLLGWHVQIIFYTLFAVAIYFIYFFFYSLKKKDNFLRIQILKSAFIFFFALVIAVGIQSDNLTQVYEYTPYSTRGTESILEKEAPKTEKSESDYYSYHTEWSFSPGEVLTFLVPSYYGFGNSKYKGPLTNNQEVEVNTYFGQMRFVDVAMYMGVLVFLLGLYAMIALRKDPFVQYLTILTVISLLISFGKNFPVLFDLMFYYFPYFNKFRVPSMILVLVQMSMPVLAGLGLMKLISLREEKNEKLRIIIRNISFAVSGIFVLVILLNNPISKWFVGRVNDYAASIQQSNPQLAQQYQVLADYTAQMFTTDLTLAFLFISIGIWSIHLFINKKLSADILVGVFIILTIVDLWRIDSRGAKYIDNPDIKSLFTKPDYISFIEQQNEKEPFRIFNLKQDGSIGSFSNNANFHAYFLIEDFYGYSGIKPRAYQDYMDVVGPANPSLWNMLNVKYIIANQPVGLPGLKPVYTSGNTVVMQNENSLPRLFFVNKIEKISALEYLNKMKAGDINPAEISIVENANLKIDPVDSTASIKILKYDEALIEAEINASGKNFIFIGNSYHPGWKAYLNGEKIKIYKTNHGYLGVVVPKGRHLLKVEYAPESFFIAKNIALVLSSLVILGLIVTIGIEFRKKRK
ncbi:YfhO family protein [Ignavibacterium album]|uniref:YfhO family protein n=1 Tax=Ignavibacterium album TaxID=591197 RepID=UPI0026EA4A5F|nr:YfhO family protein [Ignavibacterium album]